MSIVKGKAKELEIGWWDLLPLAERDNRPVAWSGTSTIFAAHGTKPRVIGRHFPSLRAFELPVPPSIDQSPNSYDPPTVISISSSSALLFAYFPGQDVDGVGCMWSKGIETDTWVIRESWSFARGAGVVTGTWLSSHRHWTTSDSGSTRRLPPNGPSIPYSPMLILVTQTQQLELWYLRPGLTHFTVLRAPLTQPHVAVENVPQSIPPNDPKNGPGGSKLCVAAAVGIGYSDNSIIVAMRTFLYPPPSQDPSYNAMDMNFPLNMPEPSATDSAQSKDWEFWGESPTIELCEVQVQSNYMVLCLKTKPIAPIVNQESCLSNLVFIPNVPGDAPERMSLRLAAAFISFGDYTSTPQTMLSLYNFTRTETANWSIQLAASRNFGETPLAFISPVPRTPNLLTARLAANQTFPRKGSEVSIGTITMLNLGDLSDDTNWEQSSIMIQIHGNALELPLSGVLSPNNTLLCCTSPSANSTSPLSVQLAPCRKKAGKAIQLGSASEIEPFLDVAEGKLPQLTRTLISAMYGKISPADISHVLARPGSSLDHVSEILVGALCVVEKPTSGTRAMWVRELLGVALEVYRTKARQAEGEELKELEGRWQNARDLCTVSAYNWAFEDCSNDEGYDLDAVWQLIGLSHWVVGFLERLMKECILFASQTGENVDSKMDVGGDDLFGSVPASPENLKSESPTIPHIFLHIVHPYSLATLHCLLEHLKRFRAYLGGISAANAQIAKDVLVDLIDSSGIDLAKLDVIFATFSAELKSLDIDVLRKSLIGCRPVDSLRPTLQSFANKINTSNVVDKPRLFIKPSDLIDGISKISLSESETNPDVERDVISKLALGKQPIPKGLVCLRCGGRSERGGSTGNPTSPRWKVWERIWSSRCICNGLWRTFQIAQM